MNDYELALERANALKSKEVNSMLEDMDVRAVRKLIQELDSIMKIESNIVASAKTLGLSKSGLNALVNDNTQAIHDHLTKNDEMIDRLLKENLRNEVLNKL